MLPYFHIISPSSPTKMSVLEIPSKPRRKKPDVPVHKGDKNEPKINDAYKSYGANFNSKKTKQKNVDFRDVQNYAEFNVEPEMEHISNKISRKHLHKENERLTNENEELNEKLFNVEETCSKKINKLREKLSNLESYNGEIINENNILKIQNKEILINYEELKMQLEIAKNCKTCEELKKVIEKNNADYIAMRKTNKELLEDINMLKNVVYRLNVQMEGYQEKLHRFNIKPTQAPALNQISDNVDHVVTISSDNLNRVLPESHTDHSHTPISWGKVNNHTLGPLLDSYQETIREKEEIIQAYETELSTFTGKLKEILKENEILHRRLTEDNECSSKLSVEIENIKEELQATKNQNDLLIKKCALKQDKLEEVLKCYEHKVEQMKRDYALVHEQYYKSRTEIAALKEKNKSLIDTQDDFKNERQNYIPISVHTASVNECKKWYEELKFQYENEKTKMKENICSQNEKIGDLNNKITNFNSEKEELENKIRLLEKHIKKSETKYLDLQHTLNEVQLSRSACRKQLNKAMNFAKDLVTEQESLLKALNQRQQENKIVKRLGSDIASRMDSLKSQLKTVQRDAWQELSTVEERLQEQDSLITSMKREHNEEVEKLKQIIKEKEENSVLLKQDSSIPLAPYLLFRDRNMNK